MAKSHEEKQFVQMSGEFGVVSELFRRGMSATLTYGNSKSADVYVLSRDCSRAVKVEVKSTVEKTGWLISSQAAKQAKHIVWVFAYLPDAADPETPGDVAAIGMAAPRYYILTSDEVHNLYQPKLANVGPIKFSIGEVQNGFNAWHKVRQASEK